MVTLPAVDGQIGVFPHHIPLMTQASPARSSCARTAARRSWPSAKGSSVTGTHVAIVTDMAVAAESIDEAKAEEARQRAPPPACATRSPTRRSRRSTRRWPGRWRSSRSSAAAACEMVMPARAWLASYDRTWLRGDVVAGITLAAYLLPAAIGDASLAGLPPEAGLYACLFGGLVFWLFCSSRQTTVTITSAISLLIGASLGEMSAGDPARQAALAACTALLVAALAFVAYAVRAGAIVNFFSETVLVGFKCGVALFLASTQLPKLFGFSGSHGDFWERMGHFIRGLGGTNPTSLALGMRCAAPAAARQRRPEESPGGPVRGDWRHRRGADVPPRRARRRAARRGAPWPADAGAPARQPRGHQRAPAARHGLLRARGGGNHRDRTDVRRETRVSTRCDAGIPRDRRRQSRRRPRRRTPSERRHVAVARQRNGRRPDAAVRAGCRAHHARRRRFFTGLLRTCRSRCWPQSCWWP